MINFKIFEKIDKEFLENLNIAKNNNIFWVFQLPEWINAVINNSKNLYKLKIVFIYNGNDIILVAPLCIRMVYGCKELSWLSSDIIDYNSAIISDLFDYNDSNFKNIWKIILKDLQKECDLVFFNKIPEFIKFKKNPLIDCNYKCYQKSYQLNLNEFDYNSFYNKKNNNKSQQTDRRKEKKLNDNANLIYSYEKVNFTNFKLVEKLIFDKMSFYKNKKEKTFDYKVIVNQYKELVSCENSEYKFNLSILKKNNVKISTILGVIFNKIYYYLIAVTHNSEFIKFSPGRFHIINLINWSIANNIQSIDFTGGDELYKRSWSNNDFRMFYYIKPLNLKGLIRAIFLNLYYKLRKNYILKKIYNFI
jgi:CelD/BcsL family acetyltransferase involved in cellulose biosynthesis